MGRQRKGVPLALSSHGLGGVAVAEDPGFRIGRQAGRQEDAVTAVDEHPTHMEQGRWA